MAKSRAKTKSKAKSKAKPQTKSKAKAKARPAAKTKARPASKKKAPAKKKQALKAQPVTKPEKRVSKALAPNMTWVSPHLVVRDVRAALDFYKNAFRFTIRAEMPGPDGKLMHAELIYNDSPIMLGPESPERGSFAPQGPSPVTLYVYVENVDELASRAASQGAKIMMEPADQFWGDRCCVLVDPDGHSWMFATHVKDVAPEDMHP